MKNSIFVALLGASFLFAGSTFAAGDAKSDKDKVKVVKQQPFGNATAGKAKTGTCVACHNVDGNSSNTEWPTLAGQSPEYTYEQLKLIKSGKRIAPLMVGQLDNMSDQDLKNISAYFAEQTPKLGAKLDKAVAALGESLYRGGNPEKGIPACAACHGVTAAGIPMSQYPRIAGQQTAYTVKALNDFAQEKRKGTANQKIMKEIAGMMSEEEIKAVSAYIRALQ